MKGEGKGEERREEVGKQKRREVRREGGKEGRKRKEGAMHTSEPGRLAENSGHVGSHKIFSWQRRAQTAGIPPPLPLPA